MTDPHKNQRTHERIRLVHVAVQSLPFFSNMLLFLKALVVTFVIKWSCIEFARIQPVVHEFLQQNIGKELKLLNKIGLKIKNKNILTIITAMRTTEM